MKLLKAKWMDEGADPPNRVGLVFELESEREVMRMQEFIDRLEREEDGFAVDRVQEAQDEYEKNKVNLCPHGMNPSTCFELACRVNANWERAKRRL